MKIIDRSLQVKKEPEKFKSTLTGKKLYMLFQKTSTRTALSFGIGMNELGGFYLSQNWEESNFCVGEIKDEIRYVARNVNVIMARLKKNEDINLMAEHSSVPVINGCCNKFHPCQAAADLLTIKEIFGGFNINLLYVGILNNVFNSLAASLPRLGCNLTGILPIINEPSIDPELIEAAMKTGRLRIIDGKNLSEGELKSLVNEVDVVYTDSWVDMEFFNDDKYENEKNERIKKMMPYQINAELLKDSKCIVMHDMPIHSGYEITREIIEKHGDTIFTQSENRRHAQKAVLLTLFENTEIRELFGD